MSMRLRGDQISDVAMLLTQLTGERAALARLESDKAGEDERATNADYYRVTKSEMRSVLEARIKHSASKLENIGIHVEVKTA